MNHKFTILAAQKALAEHRQSFDDPQSHQACFHNLFRHGTLELEMYQPIKVDLQTPHDKDEVYFIASGSGCFEMNGERRAISPGDVLFVPAGTEHRFVDFSDDFTTWVVLYGPPGGEKAVAAQ